MSTIRGQADDARSRGKGRAKSVPQLLMFYTIPLVSLSCKKEILMKRVGAAIVLAMLCTLAIPAYCSTCSNATLKGAYAYQDVQQDPTVKWFIVGIMKFDGTGKGTVGWTLRGDDGTIDVEPNAGLALSYSVTPDCTFTFEHANGLTFSGAIANDGNELKYVEITGWQFRMGSANKVTSQNQQ